MNSIRIYICISMFFVQNNIFTHVSTAAQHLAVQTARPPRYHSSSRIEREPSRGGNAVAHDFRSLTLSTDWSRVWTVRRCVPRDVPMHTAVHGR